MAVNTSSWKKFPVAAREQEYDADDAIARITSWAAGSAEKFSTGFLWRNSNGPANNKSSYRLPVIDVVNGKASLIPHAVQSAARILSGAHGGLEGVVDDKEKQELKSVVSEIYQVFQDMWGDPRTKPPWELGGNEPGGTVPAATASAEGDLIASVVAPVAPPKEWFTNPNLDGVTQLEVTADGRVFGHLATFGRCHVGMKGCRTAPHNTGGYRYFQTGTVLTADGTPIKAGRITMDSFHPSTDPGVTAWEAYNHYANTGMQIAVVAVGEDPYGIWVAGSVVPEATPEEVARLRRSPLSGDWRPIDGALELTGALAVNDPGFPIVATAEDGEVIAMVSVGMVEHQHAVEPECVPCNSEKFATAAAAFDTELARIEQMQRASRLAALKE